MGAFQDYIKPTAVLTVICLLVSGALAYTQGVTAPIIEESERKAAEAARAEVLPMADGFTKAEIELPAGVSEIYTANNGEGVVITTANRGYGGDVVMMCGIGKDGKIVNVKVLKDSETPGIGSKVLSKQYLGNLSGKDSSLEGVDAITGATMTSRAVAGNLKQAFEAFGEVFDDGSKAEKEEMKRQYALRLMGQLVPEGGEFTEVPLAEAIEGVRGVYQPANGDAVLVIAESKGYHGIVASVTAISKDGKLIGIKTLEEDETPEIGGSVLSEEYLGSLAGVDSSLEGVEGVTGATLTYRAVKGNLKKSFTAFDAVMGGAK